MTTIHSCVAGTNADLFPHALELYVAHGARIADVTYGRGVFWNQVDRSRYALAASDLMTGIDFRHLPYADDSFDAVVLDPPYMAGGKGVKASLNNGYQNPGGVTPESVVALYLGGILEARRVLVAQGILFVKCQPQIESHKQYPIHAHLQMVLPLLGFRVEDEFVLHQAAVPLLRHATQQHARKNHSFLLVARWCK